MKYYIGIDGGGTKTLFRVVNQSGETIDVLETKGSNISSIGYESTKEILSYGISELLEKNNLKIKDCYGLCMGASGVDRDLERKKVENIFYDLGFKKVLVKNDAYIVLASQSDELLGLVAIAGTGSIVLGINEKENSRVGGWGYKLGDEGSAYWIGMQGIKAVLNAHDGLSDSTMLTNALLKQFKLSNVSDFIELFYEKGVDKIEIASLSTIVNTCAIKEDRVALRVLRESSKLLASHVLSVYNQMFLSMDKKVPLVLNGSVLLKSKVYRNYFIKFIKEHNKNIEIIPLSNDPTIGACRLAFRI